MAKLHFNYGTMNCAKSTRLLQLAYNYEETGKKIILVKPSQDTKANDKIEARIGISRKVDLLLGENDNIFDIVSTKFYDLDAILVDEAQFLREKQADELLEIVDKLDIDVYCYGLRIDAFTNGFEGSTRLLIIAHELEKMKTLCKCKEEATFVLRKENGAYVFYGEQVAIDNKASIVYEPCCSKCYREKKESCKML